MLSLDKKIFDPASVVAQRMITHGKNDELFILVPTVEEKAVKLSEKVYAIGVGGSRFEQYYRLKKIGVALMKEHTIHFVTVQDPSYIGNIGRWLKNKTGAMLEIQVHGDFYGSDFYKKTLKDFIGYFIFGKRNIRAADRIRVVGERVKRSVLALGVEEKKIVVEPVVIPAEKQYAAEANIRNEFPGYEKYFLCLGRLEPVKNIDWLIGIFDRAVKEQQRNFCLLIVGEGSEKEQLQALVKQKSLEKNIFFKEYTTNPKSYYQSVDCVLFPSKSEGYGLVVMEAIVAGTPVIMNDVGVANFEVKPSKNVRIIPIQKPDQWLAALGEV